MKIVKFFCKLPWIEWYDVYWWEVKIQTEIASHFVELTWTVFISSYSGEELARHTVNEEITAHSHSILVTPLQLMIMTARQAKRERSHDGHQPACHRSAGRSSLPSAVSERGWGILYWRRNNNTTACEWMKTMYRVNGIQNSIFLTASSSSSPFFLQAAAVAAIRSVRWRNSRRLSVCLLPRSDPMPHFSPFYISQYFLTFIRHKTFSLCPTKQAALLQ